MTTKLSKGVIKVQRVALCSSQSLFTRWYDALEDRTAPHTQVDENLDDIDRIVEILRRDGVATWPGMFSNSEQLTALRAEAEEAISRARVIMAELPPSGKSIDSVTGAEIWKGSDPRDGRTRATLWRTKQDSAPQGTARLFDDDRMQRVVSAYYNGAPSWCNALLTEELKASRIADAWHFDKLYDQVKVMILLNDTHEEDGPLRYRIGSHRRDASIDLFFHRSFSLGPYKGPIYNYPSKPIADALPGEERLCTGNAGDAVFFDTLGIHSGTLCWDGRRLAIVASFNTKTKKNLALSRMFAGLHPS